MNTTQKILTVVVPTYNMEDYLDRCLSSLIIKEELMAMLEVLVVNDGSKDRSSEIAHSYEAKHPETFKVIDKENGNYGSCVNAALPIATGKYIKILDADDWFETDNFQEFISFLNQADADLVISHTIDRNSSDSTSSELTFPSLPDTVFSLKDFSNTDIAYLFMHSITYKTAMVRESGYEQLEHISYTDLQWATEPMVNVNSCHCFHKAIYNYCIGRDGQTIDASAHCKNMWMEEKVLLHIVSAFESRRCDLTSNQSHFLKKKVKSLIQKLYGYYLHEHAGMMQETKLAEFDNQLRQVSPDIYQSVEDATLSGRLFNFRYIREWRKKHSRKTFKFSLFDAYCRIRHSF